MLGSAYATLPVHDLEEAKKFYSETLGLELLEENAGGVYYQAGSSRVLVYPSEYAGSNKATAVAWEVDDVEKTIDALKSRGVRFEQYDNLPGVTREGDVHIMGSMKAAWFKDPSGNILSIGNV